MSSWTAMTRSIMLYILRCSDNTFYTGYTTDPERRTRVHNSGKGAKYTRARRPVELIYTEEFDDKREAQRREYAIKQMTRAEKEKLINAQLREERSRTLPLLKMPAFDKDKKKNIISWIEECYSDELVIHKNAEKSFNDDNRNLDWHKFCMMIHYLAGYTKYRNAGGVAINPSAAREYDPEESSFMVEPAGTGQGATEIYKDKYTISIKDEDGKQKNRNIADNTGRMLLGEHGHFC